jgi:L-alanine-DL-glutamate epimerase-like enolase superfamily enzyme
MRDEKPGGHGERSVAVGTLDMAIWDATAKIAGQPLYRLLSQLVGGGGAVASRVPCYAAGGYRYPTADIDRLRDEVRGLLDLGYAHVKIKIGGESLANTSRVSASRRDSPGRTCPPTMSHAPG